MNMLAREWLGLACEKARVRGLPATVDRSEGHPPDRFTASSSCSALFCFA